jgi:hypothetical protein
LAFSYRFLGGGHPRTEPKISALLGYFGPFWPILAYFDHFPDNLLSHFNLVLRSKWVIYGPKWPKMVQKDCYFGPGSGTAYA